MTGRATRTFNASLGDALWVVGAVVLGLGSLLLFGIFLWVGPLRVVDLGMGTGAALLFDALLSLAFFVQHSVMVRRGMQARLGSLIGAHRVGVLYAVASGIVLALVVLLWQPAGPTWVSVQGVGRVLLRVLLLLPLVFVTWAYAHAAGIDPLGLSALRRRGRTPLGSSASEPLVARGPFRLVRHPMYLAVLVMLWAHPDWSADRLLLAVLWSAWTVVGAVLEEKDLVSTYGDAYLSYRGHVRMLLPFPRRMESQRRTDR